MGECAVQLSADLDIQLSDKPCSQATIQAESIAAVGFESETMITKCMLSTTFGWLGRHLECTALCNPHPNIQRLTSSN